MSVIASSAVNALCGVARYYPDVSKIFRESLKAKAMESKEGFYFDAWCKLISESYVPTLSTISMVQTNFPHVKVTMVCLAFPDLKDFAELSEEVSTHPLLKTHPIENGENDSCGDCKTVSVVHRLSPRTHSSNPRAHFGSEGVE